MCWRYAYLNEGFACFMVCSMASLERRKCKVKFDPIELEVLVDEANKHLIELLQRSLVWSHSRSPECVETK